MKRKRWHAQSPEKLGEKSTNKKINTRALHVREKLGMEETKMN